MYARLVSGTIIVRVYLEGQFEEVMIQSLSQFILINYFFVSVIHKLHHNLRD